MSHEVKSMAYVGATPWHGLGNKLSEGASIDTWVKEAGMEYELLSSPVIFSGNDKKNHIFPGRQIYFRSDTQAALGFVSNAYKVVQPREVVEFFRSLAEDHGFELETAGVLFGGTKYWALAKTPNSFKVGKKDEVKGYLMLATSCDGSMSTTAKYVATRVVCNNTIQLAMGEKGGKHVRVRHNSEFKAENVKEELGLYNDAWKRFMDTVVGLGNRKVTPAEMTDYLIRLMGVPGVAIEEQRTLDTMKVISEKFLSGNYIGSEMSGNSAWGMVNCVTEWCDHNRGRSQDRRLDHAWFGPGVELKIKALEEASVLL